MAADSFNDKMTGYEIYIEELESENRELSDRVSHLNNENVYLRRTNDALVDSHARLESIINGLNQVIDEKDRIINTQQQDLSKFGGILRRIRSLKSGASRTKEKALRKVNEKKMSR